MEKLTVKKIYDVDNYNLIRAIVIGIAYREKMKNRKNFKEYLINKLEQYTKQYVTVIYSSARLIYMNYPTWKDISNTDLF